MDTLTKTDTFTIQTIGFILLLAFLYWINHYESFKKSKRTNTFTHLKIQPSKDAHGILFGKKGKKIVYSPEDNEGHILVTASSGTGKTSSIAIPTIRSWSGPCFVLDISGDICRNCPNITNKLIYDYSDSNTTPYNIFGSIDTQSTADEQNEQLVQLAFLLMPDKIGMNDNAAFFYKNGRAILIATLIAYYHQGMDFSQIMKKIANTSWQQLFCEIDDSKNNDAITYINSFAGNDTKNTAGCYQSMQEHLSLFLTNKRVQQSLRRPLQNEASITPFNLENNSLFFVIPEDKLMMLSPLLNIITSQVMDYISQRITNQDSKTILLVLDEFASLELSSKKILDAVRRFRKRKCRIMILTQNICDFDVLYQNHEITRAILSNLKFKVLLGGGGIGDLESQKYFSSIIGKKNCKRKSKSKNAKSTTYTETEDKDYIIEPAELDRIPQDTVLLLASSEQKGYLYLKKNYYFK